jgi:transcriptional regulator with PAS, ATPase and Fis domain
VQIVAASNRKGRSDKEGKIREDLYYRLKVVDLHLMPQRDRMKELFGTGGYFITSTTFRWERNIRYLLMPLEASSIIVGRGNNRELSNNIQRACFSATAKRCAV